MKNKIVISILILLVVFVVGCDSSTDKVNEEINVPADGVTDGSNVAADNSNIATEPTGSAESKVIVDNEAVSGDKAEVSLSKILSGKSLKYSADYDLTVDNKKQALTYVFNLPNFAMIVKIDEGESRMIFKDSVAYSCNNMQGEWMCLKLADVQKSQNDQLESNVAKGNAQTTYVGKCSRAGLTGEKYTVVSEGVASSVCYTTKGILLEMESEKTSMYATKVSESVDLKLFDLPAEPQDFSKMFQGIDTE